MQLRRLYFIILISSYVELHNVYKAYFADNAILNGLCFECMKINQMNEGLCADGIALISSLFYSNLLFKPCYKVETFGDVMRGDKMAYYRHMK